MRVGANEQFVHEACYARTMGNARPKKGGGTTGPKKPTGADIIGEIVRYGPEHCRHLEAQGIKPQPPRHLAGVHPKELRAWYRGLCAKAKEMKEDMTLPDGRIVSRCQRISTTILGAAVASYPGPPDDNDERYVAWRKAVVAWAKQEYDECLAGVYEHVDEPHGHIHVVFSMDGANVKLAMRGHQRVDEAKRQGLAGGELTQAYREGCQAYQDYFYKCVGQPLGLNRKGEAPEPRVSWREAQARKKAREAHEEELRELERRTRMAEKMLQEQRAWLQERIDEGSMTAAEAARMMPLVDIEPIKPRGPRLGR